MPKEPELPPVLPEEQTEQSVSDKTQAKMFIHILPVVRQLSQFLKGLSAEDPQSDIVAERIVRGAAAIDPDGVLKNTVQFADLPFAGEVLTAAAKTSPRAALKCAKSFMSQPYADRVIEEAVRAASVSPKEEDRKAIFAHAGIFADKPFAKETMLATLAAGEKSEHCGVPCAAVADVGQYGDQPWAKEIVLAAFKLDGWAPFFGLSHFVDLPWAKDVLLICAAGFPWAALGKPYLSVYVDKPWAGEIVLAAIQGGHFQAKDFHRDMPEVILTRPYAETVFSALAEEVPGKILDRRYVIGCKPWGRRVLQEAVRHASEKAPAEMMEMHPDMIKPPSYSFSTLNADLMSAEEWEGVLERAVRNLTAQSPGKVFCYLSRLEGRSYAREIALEAASRAPADTLSHLERSTGTDRLSYADEMLELAARSAVTTQPALLVKYVKLIVSAEWAREVFMRVAEDPVLAIELLKVYSDFQHQPWAGGVAERAVAVARRVTEMPAAQEAAPA